MDEDNIGQNQMLLDPNLIAEANVFYTSHDGKCLPIENYMATENKRPGRHLDPSHV